MQADDVIRNMALRHSVLQNCGDHKRASIADTDLFVIKQNSLPAQPSKSSTAGIPSGVRASSGLFGTSRGSSTPCDTARNASKCSAQPHDGYTRRSSLLGRAIASSGGPSTQRCASTTSRGAPHSSMVLMQFVHRKDTLSYTNNIGRRAKK